MMQNLLFEIFPCPENKLSIEVCKQIYSPLELWCKGP